MNDESLTLFLHLQFALNDSAEYFLEACMKIAEVRNAGLRIFTAWTHMLLLRYQHTHPFYFMLWLQPDYLPTEDDILRVRQKTTGIVETCFEVCSCPSLFNSLDCHIERSRRIFLCRFGVCDFEWWMSEDSETSGRSGFIVLRCSFPPRGSEGENEERNLQLLS